MTKLVVRLLGGYRVELDGEAIYGFEMDKARALLAYLVVEAGRPHRRETLASLLWPDRPDTVARANLRQALSCVRRALSDREPPLFLFVTPTDVQFNTASDTMLDVAELEAFAHPSASSPARRRQLLPEAFCADFLAGFAVPDSEAFQAWVLSKQEHYHRLALEILDAQNATFEGIGDYEQAAAAARLQLQLEPWLEEAHRRCMRGLALAGRRDEALHQYELCRRALETELGVEPAAGTQALYADIRAGRFVTAERPARPVTAVRPAVPARLPALPARLVARADELGQLVCHLDAALAGEAGVAFVSGDAGSGKTALLEAFAALAMAEQPDLLVASARCSPGGSLDPFAPLRRLAEMLFGDPANDADWRLHDRDQVDRLQRATGLVLASLGEQGGGLIDTLVPASSIAARAGLSADGSVGPTGVLREDRPERGERPTWWATLADKPQRLAPVSQGALSQGALLDQLIRTLAAISRGQPLLLLFDDLHWVDDATAAFLLHVGRELNSSRLLVLGAYRSATVALGWRDPRSGEVIRHPLAAAINELRRRKGEIVVELDRADGRAFVEAYVDTEPNRLGARFRDALYAQTGGHALFTVESLRNLQERGELIKDEAGRWVAHESLDWGALPARVEAAIAERIDRLSETERRILSCASVQGDDFTGEVVAELAGAAVGEVLTSLSGSLARQHHLVRPEGLQRLSGGQRSTYRFTHHLFQKYLYDQLDPVERAQLHGAVAASLDRQAGSDPMERERLGARLAWHAEAGGLSLQAARALHDAGHEAMRLSAFREALSRYEHGLALLANAPPSPERTEIQRLLEVAHLGPQRNLEGIASDSLQGTLARATEAWAGHPQGRSKFTMLSTEAEHLFATGQFENALAVAERLRAEAAQWGEEEFVGLAHFYFGAIHHYMGNPQESESHLDWVLAWLTPERRAGLRAAIGMDLLADALVFSALNRWFLGHPEQALARSGQAVVSARAAGAPVGQAASTALSANLLFFLRVDARAMAELSEQCHRLCLEQGLGMWRVFAEVLLGRLMVMAGEELAGIERIGGAGWQGGIMAVATDFFVVVLADSCLLAASRRASGDDAAADVAAGGVPSPWEAARARLLATGLAAIDSMLGPARVPCGQIYEAEMRRLQGELLLARDGLAATGEALECFRRAMQLGREKGALAWELRAAMSLVRLRERQGEACAGELPEARSSLRDLYARFTEGFAFLDLQEAAALIGDSG